jgi:hypothetical protein
MKKLKTKLSYTLYLVLAVVIINGCSKPVNEKTFNLSMQKINGEWINANYTLPDDAYFFINTHRGSYSIRYDRRSANWLTKSTSGITVRNAIIDYKVNNR